MEISAGWKVTNEDEFRKVDEAKQILNTIRQHKCRWIGHILRYDGFLHEITEGRVVECLTLKSHQTHYTSRSYQGRFSQVR